MSMLLQKYFLKDLKHESNLHFILHELYNMINIDNFVTSGLRATSGFCLV